jgi:uncharacterized protein DUF6792
MNRHNGIVATAKILSAGLILALLAGCSVFQQGAETVILRDIETSEPTPLAIASGALYAGEIAGLSKKLQGPLTPEQRAITVQELDARKTVVADLRHLHEFAILSAGVYGENWRPETLCETGSAALSEWKDITGEFDFGGIDAKIERQPPKGFEMQVWAKESDRTEPLAVLVFRGTNFESFSDWLANLRWFIRPFTFDQYDYTMAMVPKLVSAIQEHYKDKGVVEIMATGHSLGGGLAQQAGYVSPDIEKVYAFAPSPVTGFFSVEPADRQKNKTGMEIYRVFEHGEVLAYLRWFMKGLMPIDPVDPKIVEIRYNLFSDGNMLKQHGMKDFACALKEIAETASRQAGGG